MPRAVKVVGSVTQHDRKNIRCLAKFRRPLGRRNPRCDPLDLVKSREKCTEIHDSERLNGCAEHL